MGLAVSLVRSAGSAILDSVTKKRLRAQLTTVILQALELEAKSTGKSLEYPSGASGSAPLGELDAVLPEGLGDWAGPVGVEVWLPSASQASLDSLFERLSLSSDEISKKENLSSLLFIHCLSLTDSDSRRLKQ